MLHPRCPVNKLHLVAQSRLASFPSVNGKCMLLLQDQTFLSGNPTATHTAVFTPQQGHH